MATDWTTLEDAYGSAEGIPGLLERLDAFPDEADWQSEPWYSLWSALHHQGDIYSASLAAVPEIVATLAKAPCKATLSFYLLPASIAVADNADPVTTAPGIRRRFEQSLVILGTLAATAMQSADADLGRAARAAFLVSRGEFEQAQELMERDS